MRKFGAFVNANSEAIFGTKPWVHQSDFNKIWFAIIFMGIIIVFLLLRYTSSVRSATGLAINRVWNPQQTENTIIYAFVLDTSSATIEMPSVRITEKV